MKAKFEVLIDESFVNINTNEGLKPIDKKHILSLINDYESGDWRYDKFQEYIWNNVAETALSKDEKEQLVGEPQTILVQSAKKLRLVERDAIGSGSELSEILLYGIMKNHYKALSVVPKIFYKQNAQDNAKGADSVHIVIEENDDFSLWFGEAKFYQDISGAIDSAIASIKGFLSGDQIRKENRIITSINVLSAFGLSDNLIRNIKQSLSQNTSLDLLKPKMHIPILLLHECDKTKNNNELTQEYKDEIITFHKETANKYFNNYTTE